MNVGYVVKRNVLGEKGKMCPRSYGCVSGLLGMYISKFCTKVPFLNRVPTFEAI